MNKGYLILEDGTRFSGESFGYPINKKGEAVFNTAMVGYPESLTDPSYMGQILVQTFPMVGNYGMPSWEKDPSTGIDLFFESGKIWVQGLIVADYGKNHNHWNAVTSLEARLKEEKVPALSGIDTRALAKHIREHGSMKATIVIDGVMDDAIDENFENRNLVAEASIREVVKYGSGKKKILFVDCGTKNNIMRQLITPDVTLIRVPWDFDLSSVEYDALFVSNGPGDPTKCGRTVEELKKAFAGNKPSFGVCMGHQLFGLAAGAKITKLQYGHHGYNQPIREVGTDRCFITSQNHCYCIDATNLSADWAEWFVNLNDGSNAGLRHKTKPFFSTQFHPECCGGPRDTLFMFDHFLQSVINK